MAGTGTGGPSSKIGGTGCSATECPRCCLILHPIIPQSRAVASMPITPPSFCLLLHTDHPSCETHATSSFLSSSHRVDPHSLIVTPYVYCHYSGQLYGKCEQVWDVLIRSDSQEKRPRPRGFVLLSSDIDLAVSIRVGGQFRTVRSFLTENRVARDIYVRL
jgi:hypothetical protein